MSDAERRPLARRRLEVGVRRRVVERVRGAPVRLELDRAADRRSTPARARRRVLPHDGLVGPGLRHRRRRSPTGSVGDPARIAKRFPCAVTYGIEAVNGRSSRSSSPVPGSSTAKECTPRSITRARDAPVREEAVRAQAEDPARVAELGLERASAARRRGRGSTSRRRSETQYSAPSGPHSGWKIGLVGAAGDLLVRRPRARSRGTAAADGPRRGTRGVRRGRRRGAA